MSEPRELTTDEVRDHFLRYIWAMVDYWEQETRAPTPRRKLSGLAHSILTAIDGCASGTPGFILAPCPHPDDKEFSRAEGENWFPVAAEDEHDIGGSLHERFYDLAPEKSP